MINFPQERETRRRKLKVDRPFQGLRHSGKWLRVFGRTRRRGDPLQCVSFEAEERSWANEKQT